MAKKNKSRKSKNRSSSLIDGLKSVLPASASGQILVGVVIGGTVAYVMIDKKRRAKLIRQGVRTVNQLAAYVAELREEISDIQAEQAEE